MLAGLFDHSRVSLFSSDNADLDRGGERGTAHLDGAGLFPAHPGLQPEYRSGHIAADGLPEKRLGNCCVCLDLACIYLAPKMQAQRLLIDRSIGLRVDDQPGDFAFRNPEADHRFDMPALLVGRLECRTAGFTREL
jgi:hypothetical protein